MRDYRNIHAYKLANEVVLEVYRLTRSFPKEELYCLTSQLRRSVMSIALNIVEGASRKSKREYLQFLYISRGSLAETEYLVGLAAQLDYVDKAHFEKLAKMMKDTNRVLFGLMKSVEFETSQRNKD